MNTAFWVIRIGLLSAFVYGLGCSGDALPSSTRAGSGGSAAGSGPESGSGGSGSPSESGGFGGSLVLGGGAGSAGSGSACASQVSEARLQPVYLAFVFDVSGSMGKGDTEWHDRALKWDPVVAATKAFFADQTAMGISASLVFFPGPDDICDAATYAAPAVPMTPLPSPEFAAAIDLVTPATEDDWRGGTPTLHVLEGTIGYLEPLEEAEPDAVHAIVLVTDGNPAECEEEGNSLANVQAAVAAVAERIPTYVVGVQNPPVDGAPDAVTNLNQIAVAGGTTQAFVIETGDPEQTAADLTAIVNGIRSTAVSCNVPIPTPPGDQVFDPSRVNVSVTDGSGNQLALGYDETCVAPETWRYDDATNPTAIVLCDVTCSAVQVDTAAQLSVEFGCTTRPPR